MARRISRRNKQAEKKPDTPRNWSVISKWILGITFVGLLVWIGIQTARNSKENETAQVVEEGVLVEHFTIAPLDSTEYITPAPGRRILWDRAEGTRFSFAVRYKTSEGEEGIVEFPRELHECREALLPFRSLKFISRDTTEVKITMWTLPIGTARPCA